MRGRSKYFEIFFKKEIQIVIEEFRVESSIIKYGNEGIYFQYQNQEYFYIILIKNLEEYGIKLYVYVFGEGVIQ